MDSVENRRERGNITININEGLSKLPSGLDRYSISLKIPMTIDGDKEPFVRNAAQNIQSTIDRFREKYESSPELTTGWLLGMASLDIAYRYELEKDKNDYSSLQSRLDALNKEIEELF